MLSKMQIDAALPKVSTGLAQYQKIQELFGQKNRTVANNVDFQNRFNVFYRVRRNENWRRIYFSLMEEARNENFSFRKILALLIQETNSFEASFASKMAATINPELPVIDKFVLQNAGLCLPAYNAQNRAEKINSIYNSLRKSLDEFLISENGEYLVSAFDSVYKISNISNMKKLDLALWKTREVRK